MTFYEAAVEVLRRTGRPLHYKKITEIAVREDLLSHVGKTPEVTMNDRLEKEVRKDGDVHLERTRPGVFKLDEEHAEKLNEQARERDRKRRERRRRQKQQSSDNDDRADSSNDSRTDDQNQKKSSRQAARGSDNSDHRRRSRDDDNRDEANRDNQSDRSNEQNRDSGGSQQRQQRSTGASDAELGDVSTRRHLTEGPLQLDGIARAAYKVLGENGGQSMHIDELADEIFGRKLVKFHTHNPEDTVRSALYNDNQIRRTKGHRPLFNENDDGYWRLTEWSLDADVVQREQAVLSLAEEIRQQTIQQFSDQLLDVKDESLEHLALTLLERLGYHNIKVSKRSSNGDVFFTADWRQGLADVRVCIQVVTDGNRTLKSNTVEELRDTLEHYSASEGVLIHLGDISDDAVGAGRRPDADAITLLDRTTFVELLVKHGIGVETHEVPVVTVDDEFVHALRE